MSMHCTSACLFTCELALLIQSAKVLTITTPTWMEAQYPEACNNLLSPPLVPFMLERTIQTTVPKRHRSDIKEVLAAQSGSFWGRFREVMRSLLLVRRVTNNCLGFLIAHENISILYHYFSISNPLHCTHYFSPNLLCPPKKLRLCNSNFLLQFLLLAALSRCSPVSEAAAEPDPQPQPVADPEADAHYGHWGGSYLFYITLSYLLRKDWSDHWSSSGNQTLQRSK